MKVQCVILNTVFDDVSYAYLHILTDNHYHHRIPLDHSSYKPTDLIHDDICWCLDVKYAAGYCINILHNMHIALQPLKTIFRGEAGRL